MSEPLFVSSSDLADLAEYEEFVAAARDGYRQRGEGAGASAPTTIPIAGHDDGFKSYLNSYMSHLPETGVAGTYQFSVVADGRWYMATLFDSTTGEPLAILDGGSWMSTKTGAVAAVGADALARADATSVGIIGSGRVARESLRSLVTVRDIQTVSVFSPTKQSREAFAANMDGELSVDVDSVDSSTAALSGADIVVTATTAPEPVLDGDDLEPGTHVCAMGQSGRERELDHTTVENAKYVPDVQQRALASSPHEHLKAAGAFQSALDAGKIPDNHVYAELGDVVAGRVPGRDSSEELTVFDSTGTGIETVATGYMLYEKALEKGRGSRITLSSLDEAFSE
ncbi:ornithine cyclodeaminase family protein [Salinigranum sp. GCM10025319]|uniref:ornithine cyclodeaminase family protein n=1 Tax=Salinigranum sp. GCM10025319 TaxID=3252687 RepID=UPI00361ABC4F